MDNLDYKDRKILYVVDVNARQTDSQIGRQVNLSRDVVNYRIRRLLKLRIIKGFVTILNHNALGYLAFRIFFKFRELSAKREQEIVDFLKGKVAWLVKVRGNWSFNSMVFTTNVFELERFIHTLKKRFTENLIRLHFSLITRIFHYRRGYLLNKKEDTTPYELMGEVVPTVDLDDIDQEILETIQNDARLSSIDIVSTLTVFEGDTPPS